MSTQQMCDRVCGSSIFFLLLEIFYGAISNFAAIVDSPSNVSFLVRCIQLTLVFGDKIMSSSKWRWLVLDIY